MQIIEKEYHNFWLWIAPLFALGCAFFIYFDYGFLTQFVVFIAIFLAGIFLIIFDKNFNRRLIYLATSIFLSGIFYAFFYQKTFLNYTKITGKVYVSGVGKIIAIKKFYNQTNNLSGANLTLGNLELSKAQFEKKSKNKKVTQKKKSKKSTKKSVKKAKIYKIKNPINAKEQQDLDRFFIDHSNNYQQISWIEKNGRKIFPNPPQKISLHLVKFDEALSVNDKITFTALLQPFAAKEFADDFDYELNATAKKIGASGFVIGKVAIIEKSQISGIEDYFLKLREKIRSKINLHLKVDSAAIAAALLIGDQKAIAKDFYEKIRICGLAHLLSISGFHLSLAAGIFFATARFLLAHNSYLALHFDIKKIAAFLSLFAAYLYLKIAATPLPAQRAFLMIVLVFFALTFDEKINGKRAIIFSMLLLILYNPYMVLNVGFQLSFLAVLVLATFFTEFKKEISPKILKYFFEIIILSILIQIASLPFILKDFAQVAWLGFLANILAIPLTAFFIMPIGFAALFLMIFDLEKYFLLAMQEGIFALEKIVNFVSAIPYANLQTPHISGFGVTIAVIALALILFHKNHLRIFGIIVFCTTFLFLYHGKKPDLIFDKEQKFFALYDEEKGLFFSKKLRDSKQRQIWLKHFNDNEFKIADFCKKDFCDFTQKEKRILVILKRSKNEDLCQKQFDLMVNLTGKYQLPSCINAKKVIDNFDFYKSESAIEVFL